MTWKAINNFPFYQINKSGRVRSIDRVVPAKSGTRNIKGKELVYTFHKKAGYYQVNLYFEGMSTTKLIHRLLAEAFIPNPNNLPQVNHKNGIKTDNRLCNLEWITLADNIRHSFKNGMSHIGEKCSYSKLTENDVYDILNYIKEGKSLSKIARKYKVTTSAIWRIKKKLNWKHITRNSTDSEKEQENE